MRQSNDISEHQNLIKSFLYSLVPLTVNYMDNIPGHLNFDTPLDEQYQFNKKENPHIYESDGTGEGSYLRVPYHKKARSSFNRTQLYELEKIFMESKYLTISERIEIANKVKMTDMQVKTWFQNRRTKWR